jgi:zinc transport system ATP-binding protein
MQDIAISVKNLTAKLNDKTIIDSISFNIPKGDFVFILGNNGSGKSTLIKSILGIVKESSGEVSIFGKRHTQEVISKYFGYVPQYTLIEKNFPISVKEVIALECNASNKPCTSEHTDHLKYFKAEHLINRKLSDLSGGEFQKVLISRAMVINPEIIILDEPMNNLDQESQDELMQLLRKLNREKGITVIIVTHDHNVITKTDTEIHLEAGKIIECK